uniref:CX domain-containing protein n=1 Tax=Caenorhabditis tropicalis TaxID=1561998 RepID=A0A1I7TGU2_9PELO
MTTLEDVLRKAVQQGLSEKWPSYLMSLSDAKKSYKDGSSADRSKARKDLEPLCDEYYKTDSYKDGKEDTLGYGLCCEILDLCPMKGWVIVLIICVIVGVLCSSSSSAGFFFFYWNRKRGGKEEKKEESNSEKIESDDVQISIETN